jgi:hypothetical protein
MSTQAVETILTRAMSDPAFAELLFTDADKALAGFDLNPLEISNLKSISREVFDKVASGTPEERKSFGIQLNHNETEV